MCRSPITDHRSPIGYYKSVRFLIRQPTGFGFGSILPLSGQMDKSRPFLIANGSNRSHFSLSQIRTHLLFILIHRQIDGQRGRFRLRKRTGNSFETQTASFPHHLHRLSTGRTGEGVRTYPISRHLHQRRAGATHQADRSPDPSVVLEPKSQTQKTIGLHFVQLSFFGSHRIFLHRDHSVRLYRRLRIHQHFCT